jgi:hypothetical protein
MLIYFRDLETTKANAERLCRDIPELGRYANCIDTLLVYARETKSRLARRQQQIGADGGNNNAGDPMDEDENQRPAEN